MFQKAKTEEIRLGISRRLTATGHSKAVLPGKGVVTVEVLNQLIRENPANMTQAVRSWLGRVQERETNPQLWKPPPHLLQCSSMTKLQKLAALLIMVGAESAAEAAQEP